MLKVIKSSFRGNPNVGLYLYATDSYCLAGTEVPEEDFPRIKETLAVPVYRFTVAGTGLVGAFLAGTNETLLVPSIINDREIQTLKKLGIKHTIIETTFTALGNNILCNDNGLLVSEEYPEEERKAIGKALGLAPKVFRIGEVTVVGSSCVATGKGCLAHRMLADFEKELLESTLKVPVTRGTLNLGNPYVKSSLTANDKGLIVGELSGGPEIVNAEEALRGEE